MFKIALHTWIHGPTALDRIQRIAPDAANELIACGVLVQGESGLLIPWVEEARTEADSRRIAKVASGKKGAEARWNKSSDGNAMANHSNAIVCHSDAIADDGEPMADDSSKDRRGEDIISSSTKKKRAGRPARPVIALWSKIWEESRGSTWSWQQKDAIIMQKVLTLAQEDLSEVERRARLMFASKQIWVQQNASPGLLLSKWNEFGVEIRPLSGTEVALSGGSAAAQDLLNRLKGIVGS
jgi:hypothetical protein